MSTEASYTQLDPDADHDPEPDLDVDPELLDRDDPEGEWEYEEKGEEEEPKRDEPLALALSMKLFVENNEWFQKAWWWSRLKRLRFRSARERRRRATRLLRAKTK